MPEKQLLLFDTKPRVDEQGDYEITAFVDGASRNNPGPAGIGIVIESPDEFAEQLGYFVGSKTNNQAEYLAIVFALWFVMNHAGLKPLRLHIFADSELVVKQLNGLYRVRNEQLKPLYVVAKELMKQCNVCVAHVFRHQNSAADAMANQGIDRQISLPDAFVTFLKKHFISV